MAAQVTGELYYDVDGQLLEIKRQLRQLNGYPFDPDKLKIALQNAIEGKFDDGIKVADVVLDWTKVYEKLGIKPDFPFGETTPSHWDVYVVKGLTPNKVLKALREVGVNVWLHVDDLDKAVPKNDRDAAKRSYKVSFRQNIEADPELANKSANDLAKTGVKGITLLERLLLELAYFMAKGRHLDIENVTLCTGSRYSGGNVPSVYWHPDNRKVYVSWGSPGYCHDDRLRTRAAVS